MTKQKLKDIIDAKYDEILKPHYEHCMKEMDSAKNDAEAILLIFKTNLEFNADFLTAVLEEVLEITD